MGRFDPMATPTRMTAICANRTSHVKLILSQLLRVIAFITTQAWKWLRTRHHGNIYLAGLSISQARGVRVREAITRGSEYGYNKSYRTGRKNGRRLRFQ
jgi:hypothetical protein